MTTSSTRCVMCNDEGSYYGPDGDAPMVERYCACGIGRALRRKDNGFEAETHGEDPSPQLLAQQIERGRRTPLDDLLIAAQVGKGGTTVLGAFDFPDPEVWYQVSRNARMVARLPEGQTGIEALIDAQRASPVRSDYALWARRMGEGSAGDYYLRCHALRDRPELHKELTREEFAAFRKAGGETYMTKTWQRLKKRLDVLETFGRVEAGEAIIEFVEATFSLPEGQVDLVEVDRVLRLLAARRRS